MVARQDRHPGAGAEAAFPPGVGEGVGATVEVGVGQRAALVADRHPVGVAGGGEPDRTAEGTELGEPGGTAGEHPRRVDAHQADVEAGLQRGGLARGAAQQVVEDHERQAPPVTIATLPARFGFMGRT
nr:hypothetical protein [Nocardioides marmoriginsengisoli]